MFGERCSVFGERVHVFGLVLFGVLFGAVCHFLFCLHGVLFGAVCCFLFCLVFCSEPSVVRRVLFGVLFGHAFAAVVLFMFGVR